MSDGELIARAIINCSALLAMSTLSGVEGAELLAKAGGEDAEIIERELARREAERKGS